MSLGFTEILLIIVAILLLFGGKRIPEIARAFGRAAYEYKKAKNILNEEAKGIKDAIEDEGEKPEEYEPKDV